MRNTAKRIAAMVAALMMTATGTVCFGAGPNIVANASNRNGPEWEHSRLPVHLADASEPVDPFKYDYDYKNEKEREAYFKYRDEKMGELKSEWGAYLESLGCPPDEIRYAGDINIPLGGKVTVHLSQRTYGVAVFMEESNPEQQIDRPIATVEQMSIVDMNVLPMIKYEVSDAYCLPYEFTGLKNGTACFVYQTNSVEPSFYRIIVGNGKNEGGTKAPAAQQQAATSQAPASWTAGTL